MTATASLGLWGRHLEDELVWVEPVITYVVAHGPIEAPTSWVRGREAPVSIFPSGAMFESFMSDAWFPEHVFYARQMAALRFDTIHGSVIVTDLWDDTQYGSLRGKRANMSLRIHTPLLHAARAIHELVNEPRQGATPTVAVVPVGWQTTEPLVPRKRLRAWSSCAVWEDDDSLSGATCRWIDEPNPSQRRGPLEVVKAFHRVNTADQLASAQSLMESWRAEPTSHPNAVQQGISSLEWHANGAP